MIGTLLDIPGGTQYYYELVSQELFGASAPELPIPGHVVHVAGPLPSGWRILDVWESEPAYRHFVRTTFEPVAATIGIPVMEREVFQVHNLYFGAPTDMK